MFLRRLITALASFALLAGGLALVPTAAAAHDEADFELLPAPFECGTEWVGGTRSGHGQNDWNLDFNRTSLVWPDRQHDMGQPLLAQGDGVVAYVGLHVNAGTYLDIDYGDYTVRYVHLVHDSIPAGVDQRGDVVQQGDLIGLIGDTGNATGHAHLHLEYWDSREMEVAEGWRLRNAGHPQTEITFDGNVIDPLEVHVSTNCVDRPPDSALDAHVQALIDPETALEHLVARLAESTEALNGTIVSARIPGTDRSAETVLVSTSYTSAANCGSDETPEPCPGATEHAASTALVLELAATLADAETPPRRTVEFVFWDESIAEGAAADQWFVDYQDALRTDVVAVVDYGMMGANASLGLRHSSLVEFTGIADGPSLDSVFGAVAGPEISTLHGSFFSRPSARQLSEGTFPMISFADLTGPCVATTADTSAIVDHGKLNQQLDAAVTVITDLAQTESPPILHGIDPRDQLIHDSTAVLGLIMRAGTTEDHPDLAGLVAEPPEVTTGSDHDLLRDEAARFAAGLRTETCDAHLAPAPFTDIPLSSYAVSDAALLFDLGITTGTSATTYAPADVVTREQMAAFIARVWRLVHPDAAPTLEHPFIDVDPESFAAADITLIWELGITTGTSEDTYDPSGLVTRRQMAAFLCRLWLLLHPDLEPGGEHPFTDIAVDDYAEPHVGLIYTLGITTGTSATTYSPDETVTREQMAAFLGRLIRGLGPTAA